MVKTIVASLLTILSATATYGQEARELRLIAYWQSQSRVCDEGDEEASETWIACGRSDALAAMLAERGYCLDAGINVWRVGTHSEGRNADSRRWSCALVSS